MKRPDRPLTLDFHTAAPLVMLLLGLSAVVPATAQTVPPQTLPTYQLNVSGNNGTPGQDGGYHENGGDGHKGDPVAPLNVKFSPGVVISGQTGQSSVSLLGNGGNGGVGGAGGSLGLGGYTNGGAGAGGTDGGTITITQGGQSGQTSSIHGASQVPVLLEGNGGLGAEGGIAGNFGKGGQGGDGGSGGTLGFMQASGATITGTDTGVTAVALLSNGGNAGNALSARTNIDPALGNNGGQGG